MRGVGVGRRDEASCMATGIGHHRVGRHHEASCMATGINHACVNRAPRAEYGTELATALVRFAGPQTVRPQRRNDRKRFLEKFEFGTSCIVVHVRRRLSMVLKAMLVGGEILSVPTLISNLSGVLPQIDSLSTII